jgi:hypothetical protein
MRNYWAMNPDKLPRMSAPCSQCDEYDSETSLRFPAFRL